jgi:hypothetical protein
VEGGASATNGGPGTSGSGESTSGSGEGASGDAGDGDGGVRFDTPSGDDRGGDGGDTGCQKVDFLFVVDRSGSMADEQQNLVRSFGGFIETIRSTLRAQDYHIMVVDTDPGVDPALCRDACMAIPSGSCMNLPCSDVMSGVVGDCELVGGAGIVTNKTGMSCDIAGGTRYLTDGQPDLEGTFACLADVGTDGSGNEAPMAIMLRAAAPMQSAAGGCNEGFLREDAILVVTFITDEEDDHQAPGPGSPGGSGSPGEPADWYAELLAAKGAREDAVVVLGLIGDTDQPGAVCAPLSALQGTGAEPSPRLRDFVGRFGARGHAGSVCAPDYTPFFAEAVSVVDAACDEFIPPG